MQHDLMDLALETQFFDNLDLPKSNRKCCRGYKQIFIRLHLMKTHILKWLKTMLFKPNVKIRYF